MGVGRNGAGRSDYDNGHDYDYDYDHAPHISTDINAPTNQAAGRQYQSRRTAISRDSSRRGRTDSSRQDRLHRTSSGSNRRMAQLDQMEAEEKGSPQGYRGVAILATLAAYEQTDDDRKDTFKETIKFVEDLTLMTQPKNTDINPEK